MTQKEIIEFEETNTGVIRLYLEGTFYKHYDGKKLKGETVTILSTTALVDDVYELAMYRMEQGYYYAACSILECLEKVKYPKAFLAMANCYRNEKDPV